MTIMTSYHPSVQLLYLCSAAYWLFQEAPLGVVVQAWTIYWRLWTTPLPPPSPSFPPSFFPDYFWFCFSAHVNNPQFVCNTISWMQNGTWATSVIFIMRSIPGAHLYFVFILDTSGTRLWSAWENESYNVNTRYFCWTDSFLANLLFFPAIFFCGGMLSNAADMKTLSSPHEH